MPILRPAGTRTSPPVARSAERVVMFTSKPKTYGDWLAAALSAVLTLVCLVLVWLHPATGPVKQANSFLTIGMVAYETMRVLFNQLTFLRHTNRQYNHMFAATGAKAGAVVNARKPMQGTIRLGQTINPSSMTETPVPITIQPQLGIDLEASGQDYALSIDDFSNRFIKPNVMKIANYLDQTFYSNVYSQVWNFVGTPGTTPTTIDTYLNAKQLLDEAAAPNGGDRCMVINSLMERKVVGGALTYFNPTSQISEQYIEGSMGKAAGFDWFMDQNVPTQTVGTIAATSATVTSAPNLGDTTITLSGFTAGDILNVGDILSFAGCLGVNPMSKIASQSLANFSVQAQCVAGASTMVPTVSPSFLFSGPYQNVSAAPAAGAVVSVWGATNPSTISAKNSPQGLAIHPDFAAFVTVDLPMYEQGVVEGFRVPAEDLGLSLRVLKGFLINSDQLVTRIDCLWGMGLLYGELGCRVAG
jgi:hypothetical protein